jgi:predicted benzoate:H+ symporter BenE
MRKWLVAVVAGAAMLSASGCMVMDSLARNEEKAGKVTKFVRTANGDVKPVEFTKTYTGKLIGPDGKVFRSEPTADQLRTIYGK